MAKIEKIIFSDPEATAMEIVFLAIKEADDNDEILGMKLHNAHIDKLNKGVNKVTLYYIPAFDLTFSWSSTDGKTCLYCFTCFKKILNHGEIKDAYRMAVNQLKPTLKGHRIMGRSYRYNPHGKYTNIFIEVLL